MAEERPGRRNWRCPTQRTKAPGRRQQAGPRHTCCLWWARRIGMSAAPEVRRRGVLWPSPPRACVSAWYRKSTRASEMKYEEGDASSTRGWTNSRPPRWEATHRPPACRRLMRSRRYTLAPTFTHLRSYCCHGCLADSVELTVLSGCRPAHSTRPSRTWGPAAAHRSSHRRTWAARLPSPAMAVRVGTFAHTPGLLAASP